MCNVHLLALIVIINSLTLASARSSAYSTTQQAGEMCLQSCQMLKNQSKVWVVNVEQQHRFTCIFSLLHMNGVCEFLYFLCPLGAGLLIVLCFFPMLHWPRRFVSAHISSFATNELPHQLTARFYSTLLFLFLNSKSHVTCITLR